MIRKKRNAGWKKLCVMTLALCLAFSLSACGSSEGEDNGKADKSGGFGVAPEEEVDVYHDVAMQANGEEAVDSEGAGTDTASKADADAESAESTADEAEADKGKEGNQPAEQQTVSREMLVYRGTIAIDTLEFDRSVKEFKKLIEQAGGFVEKENYTDDGTLGDIYQVEDDEKHYRYTATIRVPSASYNTIMDSAGNLGDVRSKTSDVQNVTQQYGTYQSQIKIYEAEYQRYLQLMEKASEDEYALEIEQKLFDLQVKIAEIKSNITNLETDVAYSYIDVSLTEVRKYQEKLEKTDTFFDRLIRTCKNSWNVFVFIIEKILFCFIYTWYYIAAVLLLLFIIFKVQRKNPHSRMRQERKVAEMETEEDLEEEPDPDVEEPDPDVEEPDPDVEEPEDEL